ncbi:MFS transporter [Maricaulis sp.]|uniref:MFS transporter n=1 Tax=Maricaulis sp. TaxID=1486257 RepID=UPI0026016017|nr:MFS transporter [Maricaulis sp.]
MQKPALGFWQIWNISFGFFGIQIGFALQNTNVSRIFQTLGAPIETLPLLWLAAPLTGLLVQPIIGYFSDRTWTGLGRRRPYFLAGAILTTAALLIMPNSPVLWLAAIMLWLLDASINISMEPFRAFVGDMLPSRQRTQGFAMQTIFIGAGATAASAATWVLSDVFGVSSVAPEGMVPDNVKYSFYIGAIALFLSVGWTVLFSREYTPEQLAEFDEAERKTMGLPREDERRPHSARRFMGSGVGYLIAGIVGCVAVYRFGGAQELYVLTGGIAALGLGFMLHAALKSNGKAENFFSHVLEDLTTMPTVMRRLAWVQFFSWAALFMMWIYATPAVTQHHYNATETASQAYADGANWVGLLFATYNAIAAIYALLLPFMAKRFNRRVTHAINLAIGAVSLASFYFVTDPAWLAVSMVGVGIVWASILTMPYAILSDALPADKMGVYMGIFNFFIVIPQIVVGSLMGIALRYLLGNEPIHAFLAAGVSLGLAAVAVIFVPGRRIAPAKAEMATPAE